MIGGYRSEIGGKRHHDTMAAATENRAQKNTLEQPQKNTEKHRTKNNQLVHPGVNTRPDQSVFIRVLLWPFQLCLSVFSCGHFSCVYVYLCSSVAISAVVICVLLWPSE
jgi:hypothetical protein